MIEISPQRRELLRHRLAREVLERCEETYPARVSLLVSSRTRATLEVDGRVLIFQLFQEKLGKAELRVETKDADVFRQDDPDLWALTFHRAAEAILAVRNGHKEHVSVLQGRKSKKQGASV